MVAVRCNYAPACGSGTNEAGHIIAGGQSAAHAGRHTLKVKDLKHVEGILRTRVGLSRDSRPNQRTGDSTGGGRGGGRGGRIGGRKARARKADRLDRVGCPRDPIAFEVEDELASEQLRREVSREL